MRRERASGQLPEEAGLGTERGGSSARGWGRAGAVGGRGVMVMLVGVLLGRMGVEGSFQVSGTMDGGKRYTIVEMLLRVLIVFDLVFVAL